MTTAWHFTCQGDTEMTTRMRTPTDYYAEANRVIDDHLFPDSRMKSPTEYYREVSSMKDEYFNAVLDAIANPIKRDPWTLYCESCDTTFPTEDAVNVLEPHGETTLACPCCGSGEIDEAEL